MLSISRELLLLAGGLFAGAVPQLVGAQEMSNPQEMQLQVQRIARERPPEAEVAAREFVGRVAIQEGPPAPGYYTRNPVSASGSWTETYLKEIEGQKTASSAAMYLDGLKARAPEAYWQEVAQLVVQSEMARAVGRQDSTRGQAMARMFGIEFDARRLQRGYHATAQPEAERARMRSQLEQLMVKHFDIETQLMGLELADATRRLAAVQAELGKRSQVRAERVRAMVDDILRDESAPGATAPRPLRVW